MTELIRSTDGVQIALHDLGGAGPPLVFVHATGFHAWCYRRIAERLHDIRHCYGVDLRGHGDSTTPSNDRFEWEAMAEDLGAAIEHLRPDGPIDFGVCGFRAGTFCGLPGSGIGGGIWTGFMLSWISTWGKVSPAAGAVGVAAFGSSSTSGIPSGAAPSGRFGWAS